MNKYIKFTLPIAIALLFLGCNEEKKPQTKQRGALPVGFITAKKEDVPVSFEFPAQISSDQSVLVVAKVPGTLKEQNFKAGDMVKKDDKLFTIDPQKFIAAYDSALANLNIAKAEYDISLREYNRATKLNKTNTISQKEYDAAISAFKISKAKVSASNAALKNAELDLNYTSVTAEFGGVIGDPIKDVGEYISLSDPTLVRLTKLDPIYAKFAISEVDALSINDKLESKAWAQDGTSATLSVGGRDYNGSVVFIDKVVNKTTGSIDAKAKFDNKNMQILPGSFAKIKIDGLYQKGGFKVPQIAVHQDLTSPFIYTIKDGKVAKNIVKIVYEDSKFAVVSEGLNDGDKIIMDNFRKISVGIPVSEIDLAKEQGSK